MSKTQNSATDKAPLTSLTRNELLIVAEKHKVEHDAGISKSALMGKLIEKLGAEFEVERESQPDTPMKERILELASEKKTAAQIARHMEKEGYHRIRKGYIYTILRQEGISVPKSERVVISKDEYNELLKKAKAFDKASKTK